MARIALTLLLGLVASCGNALFVRPEAAAYLIAADSANGSKQLASVSWLDSQHPLLSLKEPQTRQPQNLRSAPNGHALALPRTALRRFRLAIDWPLLTGLLSATSLRWLEIRLQI